MIDELPRGWAYATIGDVADGMKNGLYKPASFYADSGVVCLRMYNVDAGKIVWKNLKRMKLTRQEVEEYQLLPGDLLVNRVNSRELVGKTAIIPSDVESCVFESKNIRLRLRRDLVCPEFVNYKLLLSGSRHFIHNAQQVVGMASISQPQVAAFDFPLPPLAEQRRIVAKLEKLFSQVGACKQRLARIPLLLKRFRKSVLAAACSGRLTADWREQSTAITEQPTSSREADLPEIPEDWRWVKLPETGDMGRGKSRHRPRNEPSLFDGPYPFIQTGDIAQSGGRIITHKQTYSEAGLAQSRLWPAGTICITIAANIAESAILTYPACFPDSVVGIIANPKVSVAEYVEFFMRVAKTDLATFAPATAQKNINIGILNEVQVPLPPLPEQKEIVCRVESLFALADRLEARFAEGRKRVDSITQAILAKAFRGELVPTEFELAKAEGRSFESAEELLTRIRTASDVRLNGNDSKPRKQQSQRK